MSGAGEAVRAAVIAALREDPILRAELNGVFAGPAVRASAPYAEVGEIGATDWSTKDRTGRELRVPVTLRDVGERAERLMRLAEAVERAVPAMPRDLAGWRIASARFLRSRTAGEGPGRWLAVVEFRVTVLADEN